MTALETLKQAQHLGEKYVRIPIDFPNIAGELTRLIAYQKRQLKKVAAMKHSPDVTDLLSSVAESVEVSEVLIKWTHEVLTEVAKDEQALFEGSKVRTQLRLAQEINQEYMQRDHDALAEIKEMIKQRT